MKTNVKKSGLSVISSAGIGLTASLITTIVFSATCAALILSERIEKAHLLAAVAVIQTVSVFVGTFIAGKISDAEKISVCVVTAVGYIIILFGAALLFFEGLTTSFWWSFVTGGIGLILGVLLSTKKNSGSNVKRRKRRNR